MTTALSSVVAVVLVAFGLALFVPAVDDMLRPPSSLSVLALLVIAFGVYQLRTARYL